MKTMILLAAYQGEKYLPDQLASLSGQTRQDFEVLWQDDGSGDGTAALLDAWSRRDSRFRPAAEQGRHLGAAGNFLSLLRQADADLMLLCDQDDIWEPQKVAALEQAYLDAVSGPGRDTGLPLLVHSDASIIDPEGRMLAPSFFQLQGWDPGAVQLNRLLVQNNATGCMMLLNRPLAELVARHGDASLMFMHDWFIALTAAAFGRVVFVNQPLTRYRQHETNTIGASRASLVRRALRALKEKDKARARVELTYTHAEAFRRAFGDALPAEAKKTVDDYLATRHLPKWQRVRSVRKQGCLMQSRITRMGQVFFG